jgi:hypothetical protein
MLQSENLKLAQTITNIPLLCFKAVTHDFATTLLVSASPTRVLPISVT